jgi:O-antigen biosynthesis protein
MLRALRLRESTFKFCHKTLERMPSSLERARVQLGRRYRQLRDVWRFEGPQGISDRTRAAFAESLAPKNMMLPVRRADVLAADLDHPFRPVVPKLNNGDRPVLNWVIIPAGPKSGGNTTIFRIIRYLEAHGYKNRLYFYNVYRCDERYYETFVRDYYDFHGEVSSMDTGMDDAHAIVATSWPTAYPVFNCRCAGKRFYFVQDFEPHFYPAGSLSFLAENTYRMGFHAITAGKWLAHKLRAEFPMATDSFDFGSDSSHYHRHEIPSSKRCGVVFYARPEAARRGFELGLMALEIFAGRKPGIDLHFYGDKVGKLPFPFTDHGRVSPTELNDIYNQCYAGISLSLTNASLVPHEMLAAGCIPVVNDAVHNRVVLDNAFVCYAPPDPVALASELERIISQPDVDSLSRAAAASVRGVTWDDAGATVGAIFRRVLETPSVSAADD